VLDSPFNVTEEALGGVGQAGEGGRVEAVPGVVGGGVVVVAVEGGVGVLADAVAVEGAVEVLSRLAPAVIQRGPPRTRRR
jgi:hypothetical protein